jgi:hypothetical protein
VPTQVDGDRAEAACPHRPRKIVVVLLAGPGSVQDHDPTTACPRGVVGQPERVCEAVEPIDLGGQGSRDDASAGHGAIMA